MILSPKKDLNNKDKLLMCLAENDLVRAEVYWYGMDNEGIITTVVLQGQRNILGAGGNNIELIISFSQGHWEEGKWIAPAADQVMALPDALVAFTEDTLAKLLPDWANGAHGSLEFKTSVQHVLLHSFSRPGCGVISTEVK